MPAESLTYLLSITAAALAVISSTHGAEDAIDPGRAADTIILDETGVQNLRIETVEVEERDFESTVFAIGRIKEIPSKRSVLSSRISGRAIKVIAFEGDRVEEGQVLVEVESRQPGNPPPTIPVKASQSGLVIASHVRVGQPVEPDAEMLDISDRSEMWAIAKIPEKEAAMMKVGTPARIRVHAIGGEPIIAELTRFGIEADPEAGTVEGIFQIPNPEEKLQPGMRVEFAVITGIREEVMAVPRTAVQGDPAGRVVYVKDFDLPNAFVRAPVVLGEQNDEYVEVVNGLFPGDEVVTQGSYSLGFAGGGSISLKEALDAAHGHEHAEDGSELTPEELAAKEAADSQSAERGGGAVNTYLMVYAALVTLFAVGLLQSLWARPQAVRRRAMLDRLIRLSLAQRALVVAMAGVLLVLGAKKALELPVDVLPDLTKPTVTILTEVPGYAPEEVETLVTIPLENSLMGVTGVSRLRSVNDISLSLIFVEFDWGTDIYQARQFVQERLTGSVEILPDGITPYMTPVASLMGDIMMVGLRDPTGVTSPRDLRVLADWVVGKRFQSVPGIAEVLSMGGGIKQIQIQPDPNKMLTMGVSFEQVREAAAAAVGNTTGGFLTEQDQEIMVRNLAMTTDLDAIGDTVVLHGNDRAIRIKDVAEVAWDIEAMRGDAGMGTKIGHSGDGEVTGDEGVIINIRKSPGFDTIDLTGKIEAIMADLGQSLPAGVELVTLYRQRDYIDLSIGNLEEALRDGAIMVSIILFLFLFNFRVTFITLTAIPLSLAITIIVFDLLDLSVNSMTLGGLAVAIGMVVDDAIVDVENVFRRLRENAGLDQPLPKLEVIARASAEVRSSIFYATVLIILVFVPLLALSGVEGRLFTPIAIATIVSMGASFVVSLTVIPVLSSFILNPKPGGEHRDGIFVRALKAAFSSTLLRFSLAQPFVLLVIVGLLLLFSYQSYTKMGGAFLPPFREPTAVIAMTTAPGTSLRTTTELSLTAQDLLLKIPDVETVGYRVGRAERGDHVVPVSTVEFDVEFTDAGAERRDELLDEVRETMRGIPGTFSAMSGPLADRVGHMLSGVSAKVAVKIYGPDLDQLRSLGNRVAEIARGIPGLEEARVEQQAPIPQLRIEVDRKRALAYGITPGALNDELASLMGGEIVGEAYEGQRVYDIVVRLPAEWRENPQRLENLYVDTAGGQRIPLSYVAELRQASGPNTILRENTLRRFVVSINPTTKDLNAAVEQLQAEVTEKLKLPEGYTVSFEGEYQAQQEATRTIAITASIILVIIIFILYSYFQSFSFVLLVLTNIPISLIGAILYTRYTLDNISIASLVGFIAITGIAARNSIMMISHYLHLMRHEGEGFTLEMVVRGTQERLVPVLMTALSAGIALVPLILAADQPGKEILNPVAVVIVGGLFSSTLLGLGVTPALFYHFCRRAALKSVEREAPATA